MNVKARELLSARSLLGMLRPSRRSPFPDVIGTFMGRDALSLARSLLALTPDDTVLLPAYLCAEVLRPFVGKTRVEFYDVRSDLSVDPNAIRDRLTANPKVVLIINYFGFLQPHRHEIKALCASRRVPLIEDCAHALLTDGAGEIGDLSIYSFRKMLPVPDGGGLRINMPTVGAAPSYHPRIYSNMLSLLAIMRSVANFRSSMLSRAWFASRRKPGPPRTTVNASRTLPLSTLSANGIANAAVSQIVERRRADFVFWQELVQVANGRVNPAFPELPAGVCPLGFPVKVNGRDSLKQHLEARGVPVSIEWRLPSAVGMQYTNSQRLSHEMLTLPVFPALRSAQKEAVRGAFRAWVRDNSR